jgi:hypothetical protein
MLLLLLHRSQQGGATPNFKTTVFSPVILYYKGMQLLITRIYPDNNDFFSF